MFISLCKHVEILTNYSDTDFVYNDFIRTSLGLSLEERPMAIKKSDTDKKLTGATSGYYKEEEYNWRTRFSEKANLIIKDFRCF